MDMKNTDVQFQSFDQTLNSITTFISEHPQGAALRIDGEPQSGKTQLCLNALLLDGIRKYTEQGRAFMVTSQRFNADKLSIRIFKDQRLDHIQGSRPVRTLSSLAFMLASHHQSHLKLLDGDEQTQLITLVLQDHIHHAEQGDNGDCSTCQLLMAYFNTHNSTPMNTVDSFTHLTTPHFIDQLRTALARLSDLSLTDVSNDYLHQLQEQEHASPHVLVEWQVIQQLRQEYLKKIEETYPGQHRLDSAQLFVEVTKALANNEIESDSLPRFLIIDDCQDLTFAGYRFLQQLAQKNVFLILVGNNDESVQGFRGSYPIALSQLMDQPYDQHGLNVSQHIELQCESDEQNRRQNSDQWVVAHRVSQVIGSAVVEEDNGISTRPGKIHYSNHDLSNDQSLTVRLFTSPQQEIDDLVWQILSLMMKASQDGEKLSWSDMAIISHDNASLQHIGDRLEREGIPVRYSSVNASLKDSSTVCSLLAMLRISNDLEQFQQHTSTSINDYAAHLWKTFIQILQGPLFSYHNQLPHVQSIKNAFYALAHILQYSQRYTDLDHQEDYDAVNKVWQSYWESNDNTTDTDEKTPHECTAQDILFLLFHEPEIAGTIYQLLTRIVIQTTDITIVRFIINTIHTAQNNIHSKESSTEITVYGKLWELWDAITLIPDDSEHTSSDPEKTPQKLSLQWGIDALQPGILGKTANKQLDEVIRLFHHAQAAPHDQTIPEFIDSVLNAQVAADSLAYTAPKPDSITLTTPAGALPLHVKKTWIINLQDNVWPNLTPRGTLFSTETLANAQIKRYIHQNTPDSKQAITDNEQLLETLYAELRGFLVALTRSSETTTLSAVWSDDQTISPFFQEFAPELITQKKLHSDTDFTRENCQFTHPGDSTNNHENSTEEKLFNQLAHGQQVTMNGLVTLSRAYLAQAIQEKNISKQQDAAHTLALIATEQEKTPAGYHANPQNWTFINTRSTPTPQLEHTITLSPSKVDSLWQCPLKAHFSKDFTGPTNSTSTLQFGTLIHACAQWATQQHYDTKDLTEEELTKKLTNHYHELYQTEITTDHTPEDQYTWAKNEKRAQTALANIAHYFVTERGELQQSKAEVQFTRTGFRMTDLTQYTGDHSATDKDFYDLLDALSGHFAAGTLDEKTRIILTGRIDRLEKKCCKNADKLDKPVLDIVDYKTGKSTLGKSFNDLQLICYQLMLHYESILNGDDDHESLKEKDTQWNDSRQIPVNHSMLFNMEFEPYPATGEGKTASNPENYGKKYQPSLFNEEQFNQSIRKDDSNEKPINARQLMDWFKQLTPSLENGDLSTPSSEYTQQIKHIIDNCQQATKEKVNKTDKLLKVDKHLIPWVLTMLSHIFYAASYQNASLFEAKKNDQCKYCQFKRLCPLFPEESETVYGPLQ